MKRFWGLLVGLVLVCGVAAGEGAEPAEVYWAYGMAAMDDGGRILIWGSVSKPGAPMAGQENAYFRGFDRREGFVACYGEDGDVIWEVRAGSPDEVNRCEAQVLADGRLLVTSAGSEGADTRKHAIYSADGVLAEALDSDAYTLVAAVDGYIAMDTDGEPTMLNADLTRRWESAAMEMADVAVERVVAGAHGEALLGGWTRGGDRPVVIRERILDGGRIVWRYEGRYESAGLMGGLLPVSDGGAVFLMGHDPEAERAEGDRGAGWLCRVRGDGGLMWAKRLTPVDAPFEESAAELVAYGEGWAAWVTGGDGALDTVVWVDADGEVVGRWKAERDYAMVRLCVGADGRLWACGTETRGGVAVTGKLEIWEITF